MNTHQNTGWPEVVYRIQVAGLLIPDGFHTTSSDQARGWEETGAEVRPYVPASHSDALVEALIERLESESVPKHSLARCPIHKVEFETQRREAAICPECGEWVAPEFPVLVALSDVRDALDCLLGR